MDTKVNPLEAPLTRQLTALGIAFARDETVSHDVMISIPLPKGGNLNVLLYEDVHAEPFYCVYADDMSLLASFAPAFPLDCAAFCRRILTANARGVTP